MQRTILVVIGTRPEAIKLVPVVRALANSAALRPCICVSGQHREMIDQVLELFGLRPDYDLDVMQANQSLLDLTSRLLDRLAPTVLAERPAAILVQGDTTTTFAAALAGYYLRIPTGHVEAGLRSHDPYNPFPEEGNRRMVSQVATWHYAPTRRARDNLVREGVSPDRIELTGNTIVDAVHGMLERLRGRTDAVIRGAPPECLTGRRLLLVTAHRRESFGEGLRNICLALRDLAERNEDVLIVYPVHLNPHVQAPVQRLLGGHARIILSAPLDYLSFLELMRHAYLILTDSGGIQEEAPSMRVPVLVLRDTTERPEGIEAGVAQLVGTQPLRIVTATERLLRDRRAYASMIADTSPYGSGHAAEAIVTHLEGVLASPARIAAAARADTQQVQLC